jgi:ribosomal protein S27AE
MGWLLLIPLVVAAWIFVSVARDLVRHRRKALANRRIEEDRERRERDAGRLPGGAAENPIDVETPALVEPMAHAERCLRCASHLHLAEHAAERRGADRLRLAHLRCPRCGATRTLYFRLSDRILH